MVAVAQLVESRIVIPVVVGSSPISHPKIQRLTAIFHLLRFAHTRMTARVHFYPQLEEHPLYFGFTSCDVMGERSIRSTGHNRAVARGEPDPRQC
jgi:hypothetical protein